MGGICFFHILEAQMDSRLQRLDPPKRPMHYYGSTSNLVILLQFFYFSDEKTNLIYITTPGVPASLLNMGSGSSTRKRRGFIPNVKPHLLPVDDFVAQIIRDVYFGLTHWRNCKPAPPTTSILESLGWGFRWKKYWNRSNWGSIPRKASQRWTKSRYAK